MFKTECIGDAYTVSSAENLTWGEVADMYTELLGVNFRWIPADFPKDDYRWYYDRAYDRRIDNSKLLKATGLSKKDFTPIKEGLKIELKKAGLI